VTESVSLRAARRLALARAGLLPPRWSGLPARAGRGERAARRAALAVIDRFGYLQLDTVSIAGARSHTIVLLSRLEGFPPALGEELLRPGQPLFEYFAHEACWLPIELYPAFGFRREEYHESPWWWGDVLGKHRQLADELLRRVADEGPLRSVDLEGEARTGWWELKTTKKVAMALWFAGELAIRERRAFQRTYDLPERVIPEQWRSARLDRAASLRRLLLAALAGHGWATTGTLAATWRLRNKRAELQRALAELGSAGEIVPTALVTGTGRSRRAVAGWCRPADLEQAAALERARIHAHRPVLLSPFDPLLWDRARVQLLFGFEQVLEIFKPAPQRMYGYYCLPVLAGEQLVARVDLKARTASGELEVLVCHVESDDAATRQATAVALARYAAALELTPRPPSATRSGARGALRC